MANCAQLPYFDGDFWPSAIEDLIMEVQKEQAEAAQEEAEDETPGSDKAKSKKKNQIKRKNANRQGGDLTSKIYQLMDRSGFLFLYRFYSGLYNPGHTVVIHNHNIHGNIALGNSFQKFDTNFINTLECLKNRV